MPISRIETNSIAPSQTLTTPIIATTMGVGGATPAGSGSGITFPATQSASTDVNTLDDYEEGTWALTINGVVPSTYTAYYVKIGKVVTVNVDVTASSTANGSFVSLPFTVASGYHGALAVGWQSVAVAKTIYTDSGLARGVLTTAGSITASNLTNGERIIFGGSYVANT